MCLYDLETYLNDYVFVFAGQIKEVPMNLSDEERQGGQKYCKEVYNDTWKHCGGHGLFVIKEVKAEVFKTSYVYCSEKFKYVCRLRYLFDQLNGGNAENI